MRHRLRDRSLPEPFSENRRGDRKPQETSPHCPATVPRLASSDSTDVAKIGSGRSAFAMGLPSPPPPARPPEPRRSRLGSLTLEKELGDLFGLGADNTVEGPALEATTFGTAMIGGTRITLLSSPQPDDYEVVTPVGPVEIYAEPQWLSVSPSTSLFHC